MERSDWRGRGRDSDLAVRKGEETSGPYVTKALDRHMKLVANHNICILYRFGALKAASIITSAKI